MDTVALVGLVALVLLLVAAAAVSLRGPSAVGSLKNAMPVVEDDLEERRLRQQALEPQENALLERRVALDTSRGPLAGDEQLDEALAALEARYRRGEITEAEREARKVQLLGG